jgi:hypothetical protein
MEPQEVPFAITLLIPLGALLFLAFVLFDDDEPQAGALCVVGAVALLMMTVFTGLVGIARFLSTTAMSVLVAPVAYSWYRSVPEGAFSAVHWHRIVSTLVLACGLAVWKYRVDPPEFFWLGAATILVPTLVASASLFMGYYVQRSEDQAHNALSRERAEREAKRRTEEAAARALEVQQKHEEQYRIALERKAEEERRLAAEEHRRALQLDEEDALLRAREEDLDRGFEGIASLDRQVLQRLTTLHPHSTRPGLDLRSLAEALEMPIEVVFASVLRATDVNFARIEYRIDRQAWSDMTVLATPDARKWLHEQAQERGIVSEISHSWIANANFGHIGRDNLQNIGYSNYSREQKDSVAQLLTAIQNASDALPEPALAGAAKELSETIERSEDPKSLANRLIGMAQVLGDVAVPLMESAQKVVDVFS